MWQVEVKHMEVSSQQGLEFEKKIHHFPNFI
jgi:hypothetical protein